MCTTVKTKGRQPKAQNAKVTAKCMVAEGVDDDGTSADDAASELSFDLRSDGGDSFLETALRSRSAPPSMPTSPYALSLAAIAVQPLSHFFESDESRGGEALAASTTRPRPRRRTRPLKRRLRPLNYIGAGKPKPSLPPRHEPSDTSSSGGGGGRVTSYGIPIIDAPRGTWAMEASVIMVRPCVLLR